MERGITSLSQLDGVECLHTFVTRHDVEGVGVGHGRHTAHTPLTYRYVGILFGGVPEDSIEVLHALVWDSRAIVPDSERGV